MGVIATAVRHLITAGVSGDDLVRAIEDIEDALPSDEVDTRSGAARRQAAYRQRKAQREAAANAAHNDAVTDHNADHNAPHNKPITNHNKGITERNGDLLSGITERNGRDAGVTLVAPLSPPPLTPPNPQISPPYNPPTTPELSRVPVERAKADPFPRPEWVDGQVWRDFLANRKRKKLANTATAHKRLMDDIHRHADDDWPPGRLLEAATARGWGAIYPSIKDGNDERPGLSNQQRSRSSTGFGATVDAAERFRARHQPHRSGAGEP